MVIFSGIAESKSLTCYECNVGDPCYLRLNATAEWVYGDSIPCQEGESCFTIITHSKFLVTQ